jgi:hypothetical protein
MTGESVFIRIKRQEFYHRIGWLFSYNKAANMENGLMFLEALGLGINKEEIRRIKKFYDTMQEQEMKENELQNQGNDNKRNEVKEK